MDYINKTYLLLSQRQRKKLFFLVIILIVSIIFELLSIGIIIPAFSFLSNSEKMNNEYVIWLLNSLGNPSKNLLIIYGLLSIVFIYLIKGVILTFSFWRQSKFISEVSYGIGNGIFKNYMNQSYNFFLWRNSAHLIRIIQMEVTQLQTVLLSVTIFISEISVIFSILVFLLIYEPLGAISIGLFMTTFVLLFHHFSKSKLSFWGKTRQDYDNRMAITLSQSFGAIKDIKILGRESFFVEQYESVSDERALINSKLLTLQNIPRLYLELVSIIGLCLLIFVLMYMGERIEIILPTLGVFAASAFRLIPSANRIMSSIQNIKYAESVVSLLYKEFNLPPILSKNENIINDFSSKISLESLSFKYSGKRDMALSNISFDIYKGETIGIMGLSGSGKSTLVDLMLGLLNPSEGKIKVDDIEISSSLRSWHSQIGYVPQVIFLIDDTLRNNIALGIPPDLIDENAMNNAIQSAQLFDFINSLDEKLNTMVGERGVRLSGGQRQRIGIARALYNNPSILILDEATSSLDTETELGVMNAIEAMHGQRTILIVAHRLTTLKNCDKIFKIHSGKIVNSGPPSIML